jgi:biofilm protein TabA
MGVRGNPRRMAQFAPFASLRAQHTGPQFAAAFAYVAEALQPGSTVQQRILGIAPGQKTDRVQLGGGTFAMEQVYHTKARPDAFFESHRKYIDVQVIIGGEEAIEVEDIARLTPTMEFNEERDLIKYADTTDASRLVMRAGDVALFFPADGHMPSLQLKGSQLVHKTVVKVPVA